MLGMLDHWKISDSIMHNIIWYSYDHSAKHFLERAQLLDNRANNIYIIDTTGAAVLCDFKLTSSFYKSYMSICVLVTICTSLLVSGPMVNVVALLQKREY